MDMSECGRILALELSAVSLKGTTAGKAVRSRLDYI